MYRVAIVEDSEFDCKKLLSYLHQYQEKENASFEIFTFAVGEDLIANYPPDLDILLMDIAMEKMDGMQTARLVRRRDTRVVLIFISSMIHYGLQGYSVDALDFIVKPATYTGVKLRLDRAIGRLNKAPSKLLKIRVDDAIYQIQAEKICYVEARNHGVCIHMEDRDYPASLSLKALEQQLQGLPFYRCHNAFLVNLNYIDCISGNDLSVDEHCIPISRYKRKEFLEVWNAWGGEGT